MISDRFLWTLMNKETINRILNVKRFGIAETNTCPGQNRSNPIRYRGKMIIPVAAYALNSGNSHFPDASGCRVSRALRYAPGA